MNTLHTLLTLNTNFLFIIKNIHNLKQEKIMSSNSQQKYTFVGNINDKNNFFSNFSFMENESMFIFFLPESSIRKITIFLYVNYTHRCNCLDVEAEKCSL